MKFNWYLFLHIISLISSIDTLVKKDKLQIKVNVIDQYKVWPIVVAITCWIDECCQNFHLLDL